MTKLHLFERREKGEILVRLDCVINSVANCRLLDYTRVLKKNRPILYSSFIATKRIPVTLSWKG